MSAVVEFRKVKKRPVVVRRAKKVINSQDKSLHRSILSHSRIAAGYKKKIAALLGNNRALAHALEMAHVELTNRDKFVIELQRRLTLQSPKRFKTKLQKVCEHLHVIVALLQEVLDDCEDFAEPDVCSFISQTSNSSQPDFAHNRCENGSPSETRLSNSPLSGNADINSTLFPVAQLPPRLTSAAEMSAILEQSVLLGDESLPPVLFPENENQAMSNITTRPKSKSRSASSQQANRRSKKLTDSPQFRKISSETVTNSENNADYNCDDAEMIKITPSHRKSGTKSNNEKSLTINKDDGIFNPVLSSPSFFNCEQLQKCESAKNSAEPLINKTNYMEVSKNKYNSPEKASKTGNNKINCMEVSKKKYNSPEKASKTRSYKRKSTSKKNKKVLLVKLPFTPRRSVARENMADTVHTEQHSDICKSKISPENTLTTNKTKVKRKTFVISSEATEENSVDDNKRTSEYLEKCLQIGSSSKRLCHDCSEDESASDGSIKVNSAENKKMQSSAGNPVEAQPAGTIRSNNSFLDSQDMELTCHLMTENSVIQSSNNDVETACIRNTQTDSIISTPNFSSFMYGYDPLEGTSKNKKSNILLKKPKREQLSKIPQVKNKLQKLKNDKSSFTNKKYTKNSIPDPTTVCVNISSDMNEMLQSVPNKHPLSSSRDFDNSSSVKLKQVSVGDSFHHVNSENIRNVNCITSKTLLSNHTATNKACKNSAVATQTKSDKDISLLDSVQPIVKLDDIWTSVKSPLPKNHHDNYVYISDVIDGGIIKISTPPDKKVRQLGKELNMQNSDIDEEIKVKEEKTESLENMDNPQDTLSSDSSRRRRGASSMSYKEPPLNKKLRQGDPFTSDLQNARNNKPAKSKPRRKSRSCASRMTYFDGYSDSEDFERC